MGRGTWDSFRAFILLSARYLQAFGSAKHQSSPNANDRIFYFLNQENGYLTVKIKLFQGLWPASTEKR